ncbi:MAG: glycosyltransferase [Candidatus Bathyarchaeota archaeon]|nr:glycosyltransferase [Candidatus Bathyarchaeota archaeon]
MFEADRQLQESQKIFQETVERAENAFRNGDLKAVLAWAKIAAHFAFVRHPGFYVSAELESLLLEVAQVLEREPIDIDSPIARGLKTKDYGKMRFLFVVTESYNSGGHTPFIARWIQNTSDNSIHSLVSTAHNGDLPDILTDAITKSGGWHYTLPELTPNLPEQTYLLRAFARDWADVVVLFVHPFDPLPTAAFGITDCPPVMYCNHADHAFWVGSSVADVIVDYHTQGSILSAKRRGRSNNKLLPIPLIKPEPAQSGFVLRNTLNISNNDTVLLTVGRDEKFLPFGKINFLEVMVDTLKRYPNVRLFAVGPEPRGVWKQASAMVEGRIQALGTVDRDFLDLFYGAADLFVPSFPCGSGTALLEAGMHGLPIIGYDYAPLPHISGADDVSFRDAPVHTQSIGEFKDILENALNNLAAYQVKAQVVQENILRDHCPPGWNKYLDDVLQALPSQHGIQTPQPIPAQSEYADHYLAYLDSQMMGDELPELSFSRLVRAYAVHLSRSEARNAQAKSLLRAFGQVDGTRQSKQYLMGCMEFVTSTLK